MNSESKVPNTDPKFIYQDDPNVLAFRMGLVETAIEGLDRKLDRVINEYPTIGMLKLTLDPLMNDIQELKEKRAKEEADKIKSQQQVKYLALASLLGPLGTFVITLVLANMLGVQAT